MGFLKLSSTDDRSSTELNPALPKEIQDSIQDMGSVSSLWSIDRPEFVVEEGCPVSCISEENLCSAFLGFLECYLLLEWEQTVPF